MLGLSINEPLTCNIAHHCNFPNAKHNKYYPNLKGFTEWRHATVLYARVNQINRSVLHLNAALSFDTLRNLVPRKIWGCAISHWAGKRSRSTFGFELRTGRRCHSRQNHTKSRLKVNMHANRYATMPVKSCKQKHSSTTGKVTARFALYCHRVSPRSHVTKWNERRSLNTFYIYAAINKFHG